MLAINASRLCIDVVSKKKKGLVWRGSLSLLSTLRGNGYSNGITKHWHKTHEYNLVLRKSIISTLFHSVCHKNIVTGHGIKSSHASRTSHVSSNMNFSLNDYDCIGFDLDNTICEYNLSSCIQMEYEALANFLVKDRKYDSNYLLQPLCPNSFDFLQKGLLIDFARGNILKIDINGQVLKCSHGTRFMSEKEIEDVYGKERKWEVTTQFCKNKLSGLNEPLSEQMRALLDYFDMPAALAFARIVDSLDNRLGGAADVYNIWPDVLAGLRNLYNRDHFSPGKGGYFNNIKAKPEKYIKPCSPALIEWLANIKKSKLTFLVTGSNCDFASFTAEAGLGKEWRNLFDIVVCYARKPSFFTGCRPFISLDGINETDPINGKDLKLGNMYNQGNWQELYQLFGLELNIKKPKCLYFGDNLIQDVYTPAQYTKCDTVSVVEELLVEGLEKQKNEQFSHPSKKVLTSKSWGSYLFDEEYQSSTVWEGIIRSHAKVCIPSLSAVMHYPVTHQFKPSCKHSKDGYFPVIPCDGGSVNRHDTH